MLTMQVEQHALRDRDEVLRSPVSARLASCDALRGARLSARLQKELDASKLFVWAPYHRLKHRSAVDLDQPKRSRTR